MKTPTVLIGFQDTFRSGVDDAESVLLPWPLGLHISIPTPKVDDLLPSVVRRERRAPGQGV